MFSNFVILILIFCTNVLVIESSRKIKERVLMPNFMNKFKGNFLLLLANINH